MTAAKIWIAANQGEVGGGEVMLHHIATALRELGREVAVVAPAEPSEIADRMEAEGFEVARVPGQGRLSYMRGLRRWHGDHRQDVVWCNGLLPATALAGRARRIVHLHQWLFTRKNKAFAKIAMPGALAVLAPSQMVADTVEDCRVLANWVQDPTTATSTETAVNGGRVRVGYLGRFSFDKGFELYLDVAEDLVSEEPDAWSFTAAGAPRFTTPEEAAHIRTRLAATPAVSTVGWQDAGSYLSTIDLLVVPSLAPESFGLVAAEAMAAGVPVAVSDSGALPEVVGDGHPLVFTCDDHEALKEALRRSRRIDRTELVDAQRARWETHYSPEAGRAAVSRLLEDLHV